LFFTNSSSLHFVETELEAPPKEIISKLDINRHFTTYLKKTDPIVFLQNLENPISMNLLVALFVARTGNDSFEREFLVEDAVGMYASYVDGFHGRKESVGVIKSELEKLADNLLLDCSTRGDKQVRKFPRFLRLF
jgi:hypothetical protein